MYNNVPEKMPDPDQMYARMNHFTNAVYAALPPSPERPQGIGYDLALRLQDPLKPLYGTKGLEDLSFNNLHRTNNGDNKQREFYSGIGLLALSRDYSIN